nr:hypothetical protein [Vibrio furnissii]
MKAVCGRLVCAAFTP